MLHHRRAVLLRALAASVRRVQGLCRRAFRRGGPGDVAGTRRQGPGEDRHRRGGQRPCRQSPLRLWDARHGGQPEARRQHGVRDRLDHQGADRADPGRHGRARRSRDERPGGEIPARFGEGPGLPGQADHAARSRHLHLRPDQHAGQCYAQRSMRVPKSPSRRMPPGGQIL